MTLINSLNRGSSACGQRLVASSALVDCFSERVVYQEMANTIDLGHLT